MKRFPILEAGFSVPWEMIEAHEPQALENHDQTLETLARRGGLSPLEFWCVVNGKNVFNVSRSKEMTEEKALVLLRAALDPLEQMSQKIDKLQKQIADFGRKAGMEKNRADLLAEDIEAFHMFMDDKGAPRHHTVDGDTLAYSMAGRVIVFLEMQQESRREAKGSRPCGCLNGCKSPECDK